MQIRYKKLSPSIKDPQVAYDGDVAFDLYTREDIELAPGEWKKIPSGLALEIPEGYAGLIWDKSGLSNNYALKMLGGVIDSGYRGEVMIGVINLGKEIYHFKAGDKVAQMIIQKVEHPQFVETEELSDSDRGEKGFGSSGK
jgi:dUTP pyrophosphatase